MCMYNITREKELQDGNENRHYNKYTHTYLHTVFYILIYTLYVFIEINLVVSTYPIREYTGVRLYILYEPQIGL